MGKRIKEIDVWVYAKHLLERNPIDVHRISLKYIANAEKAKLIIELPERKKEFTESEIRKVLRGFMFNEPADKIINELFGGNNE